MENEILNNTIENIENSENTTNEISEDLSIDSLAVTLDYYDRYYEQVLNNTNTIIMQQEAVLDNQNEFIEQNNTLIRLGYCFIFIISIILIYNLLRNMIIVK